MEEDGDVSIQTLIPSPVIKQLILCRSASGEYVIVSIRERTISINGKITRLRFDIRAADVFSTPNEEDLLVITTSSGWLLVCRVFSDGSGDPRVLHQIKIGYGSRESIEGLGYTVETEYEGRAIAAVSMGDRFLFCSVGPGDMIDSPITIKEKKQVVLEDCIILHTCFLHRMKGASDRVFYFVLYLTRPERFKLAMYEWQTKYDLDSMTNCCQLPLQIETPIFFVPVALDNGAAVIVSETRLYLVGANDALSGEVRLKSCKLSSCPLGYYKDPVAEKEANGKDCNFYLLCEPATIYKVDVDQENGLSLSVWLDLEDYDMGHSFTIQPIDEDGNLDMGCSVGDAQRALITYGGDSSPGGQIEVMLLQGDDDDDVGGSDNEVEKTNQNEMDRDLDLEFKQFENWAPVSDFYIVEKEDTANLYACTGQNQNGALTKLDHGIHAISTNGIVKDGLYGYSRIYYIQNDTGDRAFLIISDPSMSQVFRVDYDEEESLYLDQSVDEQWEKEEILAIEFLPNGVVEERAVMVTPSGIYLTDMHDNSFRPEFSRPFINYASILGDHVLLCSTERDKSLVSLFRIQVDKEHENFAVARGSIEIVGVTSVQLHDQGQNGGGLVCFIGTNAPSVVCLSADNFEESLVVLDSKALKSQSDDHMQYREEVEVDFSEDCIPSVICPLKDGLVIGLRNGICICCDWKFKVKARYSFGKLPIRSITPLTDSKALVLDTKLMVVDVSVENDTDTVISGNKLYEPQPVISSFELRQDFAAVCKFQYPGTTLATVLNGSLQFLQIEGLEPRVISRPISTFATTPRRMVYLKYLSIFAVALDPSSDALTSGPLGPSDQKEDTTIEEKEGKEEVEGNSTAGLSHLTFVNPKNGLVMLKDRFPMFSDKEDPKKKTPIFSPDERVRSMCEWNLNLSGTDYSYLVVGTSTRVLSIRVIREKQTIRLRKQFSWNTEQPVFALAPWGNSILFSTQIDGKPCIGIRSVVLDGGGTSRSGSGSTKHRVRLTDIVYSKQLSSPVIQISVSASENQQQQLIYASTLSNSVMVFEYSTVTNEFTHIQGDPYQRKLMCHYVISEDEVLACDKSRTLVCLSQRPNSSLLPSLQKKYSVGLPSVVTKIQPVDFKKLWQLTREPTKCFIASGIDGSFYVLKLLTPEERERWPKPGSSTHMPVDTPTDYETIISNEWTDFAFKGNVIAGDYLSPGSLKAQLGLAVPWLDL